jgi:hypothetical protein
MRLCTAKTAASSGAYRPAAHLQVRVDPIDFVVQGQGLNLVESHCCNGRKGEGGQRKTARRTLDLATHALFVALAAGGGAQARPEEHLWLLATWPP